MSKHEGFGKRYGSVGSLHQKVQKGEKMIIDFLINKLSFFVFFFVKKYTFFYFFIFIKMKIE